MSWVVRDDFPRSRKGWDPEAVRDHLLEVEEEIQAVTSVSRMSGRAAEGVRRVVQAAEETLAELTVEAQGELDAARAEAEAIRHAARDDSASLPDADSARNGGDSVPASVQRESERILAAAREEARQILVRAEGEAAERLSEAEAAVEGLVAEAMAMGRRLETLGNELERGFAAGAISAPTGELPTPTGAGRSPRRFLPGGPGGSTPPAHAEKPQTGVLMPQTAPEAG